MRFLPLPGVISLNKTRVNVDEDGGNVTLCVMADESVAVCLSVTSHENDAGY